MGQFSLQFQASYSSVKYLKWHLAGPDFLFYRFSSVRSRSIHTILSNDFLFRDLSAILFCTFTNEKKMYTVSLFDSFKFQMAIICFRIMSLNFSVTQYIILKTQYSVFFSCLVLYGLFICLITY